MELFLAKKSLAGHIEFYCFRVFLKKLCFYKSAVFRKVGRVYSGGPDLAKVLLLGKVLVEYIVVGQILEKVLILHTR